jgi:hypothetical protein
MKGLWLRSLLSIHHAVHCKNLLAYGIHVLLLLRVVTAQHALLRGPETLLEHLPLPWTNLQLEDKVPAILFTVLLSCLASSAIFFQEACIARIV